MFSLHFSGSNAILLRFKQEISRDINTQVLNVKNKILQCSANNDISGIEEVISAYTSLLVCFDLRVINSSEKLDFLMEFLESLKSKTQDFKNLDSNSFYDSSPRPLTSPNLVRHPAVHPSSFLPSPDSKNNPASCIIIPLCYDDEFAPDINFVCENAKISKSELIALHSPPHYFVYMLGFMAGFPYLGGLDEKLFTPRLSSPRLQVNAGSVGIADKQTGIYPIDSPGGWHIIARTPVKLFDKNNEANPVLLKAGMFIKFREIDKEEFFDIENQVAKNAYKCEIFKDFSQDCGGDFGTDSNVDSKLESNLDFGRDSNFDFSGDKK